MKLMSIVEGKVSNADEILLAIKSIAINPFRFEILSTYVFNLLISIS